MNQHRLPARGLFLILFASIAALSSVSAANPAATRDFDAAWSFIRDHYCFFPESGLETWEQTRLALRPLAENASTDSDRVRILETLLAQLADPHTHLRTNLASSHRLVPHDVWAVRTIDGLRIEAVRPGEAAHAAGVRPGDIVLRINGSPALEVAARVRPRHSPATNETLDQWSALVALAGTHDTPRVWHIRNESATRVVEVDAALDGVEHESAVPTFSVSQPAPGVGMIRLGTFADPDLIERFDAAVDRFMTTKALIIDVRNNRGGDTAVARPIMGRFVRERAAYATMRRRDGSGLSEPWTEYVDPRGAPYPGRIVVLVDRFSSSMAEGFAMGMRTVAGARIVGTEMSGLGAAIGTATLPESGITIQISAEPVYTVTGEPRWKIIPDVKVSLNDLRLGEQSGRDATLEAGLRESLR